MISYYVCISFLDQPTAEYRESKLMQCMVKFDTQSNISLGTTDDYNKKPAIRKVTIIVSLSEKGSVSYYYVPEVNDLLNLFHRCMAVFWSSYCRSTGREMNHSLSSHRSPQDPKCSGDESSSDKLAPRLSTSGNFENFDLSPGRSRTFCWLPCVGTRTAALHQSLCWADPLRFPGKRLLRKTKTVSCYKLDSMSRWSRTSL